MNICVIVKWVGLGKIARNTLENELPDVKYAHLLDFQPVLSAFRTQIFLISATVYQITLVHIAISTPVSVQVIDKNATAVAHAMNVSTEHNYPNRDLESEVYYTLVNFVKNM